MTDEAENILVFIGPYGLVGGIVKACKLNMQTRKNMFYTIIKVM